MSTPNTIPDGDWHKLQRGAADAAGGLVKTPEQARRAAAMAEQRTNARKN